MNTPSNPTKPHPRLWVETRSQGLYIKPADCYIDPMRPVDKAIITHGHADHARAGHHTVYTTPQTMAIMACRYGAEHAKHQHCLSYGEQHVLNGGVCISLYPAGHILGSAQVLVEYQGSRLVVSGDYKRRYDPTCCGFTPVPCDVFVTEATFALPVFSHPPIESELQRLLHSVAQFPNRCHLIGAYALGKCQRLIVGLRDLGYHQPIYLHGALVKLCELYQDWGIELGEWLKVSEVADKQSLAGAIVLAPPSALADKWSRTLPDVLTGMASGWLQIRARSKQRRVELPLVISDHCDWPELLQTLEDVNAPEIWVTHGREQALVYQAKRLGYRASALSLLGYGEDEHE
ncbi:MAG: ligase-associated DNA damage response exonuclease [Pseudomonadota bacterium]